MIEIGWICSNCDQFVEGIRGARPRNSQVLPEAAKSHQCPMDRKRPRQSTLSTLQTLDSIEPASSMSFEDAQEFVWRCQKDVQIGTEDCSLRFELPFYCYLSYSSKIVMSLCDQ